MPILIRELSIKITVDEQQGARSNGSPSAASGAGGGGAAKDEIIAECVEQVMDILKAKIEK